MVAIRPTSATSSTTEDVTGHKCHPHRGARWYEPLLDQAGAHSTLWHMSLAKLSGQTSSSLGRSTNMTAPATLKNSFKSTTRPLKLQEVIIG
jgi:hypothetical protein